MLHLPPVYVEVQPKQAIRDASAVRMHSSHGSHKESCARLTLPCVVRCKHDLILNTPAPMRKCPCCHS